MAPPAKRRMQTSIVEEEQKRQQHYMNMHGGNSGAGVGTSGDSVTTTANGMRGNLDTGVYDELSSMGMRIRQSVDQGYKMPYGHDSMAGGNMLQQHQQLQEQQQQHHHHHHYGQGQGQDQSRAHQIQGAAVVGQAHYDNSGFTVSNIPAVQDNSSYTVPEYKRVPLQNFMGNPQEMLINQGSSASSSLEMWENNLQQRLYNISNDENNSNVISNALKRGYEDISF